MSWWFIASLRDAAAELAVDYTPSLLIDAQSIGPGRLQPLRPTPGAVHHKGDCRRPEVGCEDSEKPLVACLHISAGTS